MDEIQIEQKYHDDLVKIHEKYHKKFAKFEKTHDAVGFIKVKRDMLKEIEQLTREKYAALKTLGYT